MHIFLTGPLQSGKSTAIARYLVGRPEAPGGFRTHWDRAGGRLTLELLETGETLSVATMEPPWREGRPGRLRRGGGAAAVRPGGAALPAADGRAGLSGAVLSGVPAGGLYPAGRPHAGAGGAAPPRKKPLLGALFPAGRMSGLLPLTVENRAEIPTELARLLG